jgi:hypothetical protein
MVGSKSIAVLLKNPTINSQLPMKTIKPGLSNEGRARCFFQDFFLDKAMDSP